MVHTDDNWLENGISETEGDLSHMTCPWCRVKFGDMNEEWEGSPGGIPCTPYRFACPGCLKSVVVTEIDVTLYYARDGD